MEGQNTILVAVDFSPCSAAALRQAIRVASWHNARLTALYVVEPPAALVPHMVMPGGAPVPIPSSDELVIDARKRWGPFIQRCGPSSGTKFVIEVGIPRERILEAVRRDKPLMVVVGAHSTSDRARGVGTTAAACSQRAAAPVLVVREEQSGPFKDVTACVDFSETSRLAVEQAVAIAAQDGATLRVLTVYGDPWHGLGAPDEIARNMPDFAEKYRAAIETRVREFCAPLAHELGAVKPVFHAVQARNHAEGITAFIERHGCDLAVLGTRAAWSMRDFFWGSTAERVVRECPCSVLTVKPAGFQQLAPYDRLADAKPAPAHVR